MTNFTRRLPIIDALVNHFQAEKLKGEGGMVM